DQLQLVQALEVRALRLESGLAERLVSRQHERGDPAAEHCLLAEEIGLRLLAEGGLQHRGPRRADPARVGEPQRLGLAARVLLYGDQRRRSEEHTSELQ